MIHRVANCSDYVPRNHDAGNVAWVGPDCRLTKNDDHATVIQEHNYIRRALDIVLELIKNSIRLFRHILSTKLYVFKMASVASFEREKIRALICLIRGRKLK